MKKSEQNVLHNANEISAMVRLMSGRLRCVISALALGLAAMLLPLGSVIAETAIDESGNGPVTGCAGIGIDDLGSGDDSTNGGGISGSGSNPNGPEPPPGMSGCGRGVLQRFHSIILNDVELSMGTAEVIVNGVGAIESDLLIGQMLEVSGEFDTGIAHVVSYKSDIVGPIDQIFVDPVLEGSASFQVLGQQAKTSIRTNFFNTKIEDLAIGMVVELSGLRNTDDVLDVSFARTTTGDQFRLIGFIDSTSPNGFTINQLDVDTSEASIIGFISAPTIGQRVEVIAEAVPSLPTGALVASSVEFMPEMSLIEDQTVEIEDLVTQIIDAQSFVLGNRLVRTDDQTVFRGQTPLFRTLNTRLEVEGIVGPDGMITAHSLIAKPIQAVEVLGPVSSVDTDPDDMTVTILGLSFKVDTSTRFDSPSNLDMEVNSLEDIQIGDYMRVAGFADDEFVVASQIIPGDSAEIARLTAPASEIDSVLATFSMRGVPVLADPFITHFSVNDVQVDKVAFFESLGVGDFVQAQWHWFTSMAEPPDELAITRN